MNTSKAIIFSIVIPVILLLSGCRKELDQSSKYKDSSQGISSLKVSESFDWSTRRNVTVQIPGNISGVVRITSVDDRILYYKGLHNKGKSVDVTISVPRNVNQLSLNSMVFDIHEGVCGPSMLKTAAALTVSFGSPFTFNSSGTRCPDALDLDNERFVVTYAKGDFAPCYLRVGNRSGNNISYGPEFLIPGSGWAYYSTATQLIKIDVNNILVAYKSGSGGYVAHVTVSGNSFTVNSTITSGGLMNFPSLTLLNSSQFIYAYNNESTNAGYARLCSISGSSITAGPQISVPNATGNMNVLRIDDSNALFAYRSNSTSSVRACVGQISGGLLTINPDMVIESNNAYYPSIAMLDGSHFISIFVNTALGYKGYARVGTIAGTNITIGPSVSYSDYQTDEQFVYARDASNFIVIYNEKPGSSYSCKFKTGEVSGTSITFSPATILANTYGVSPSICALGTNNLLATIRDMSGAQPGNCFLSAPLIPDTDGDGVLDPDDDYPADPDRAFNNYFPASGNGSLAFEDLWPAKGDYDFNDLVTDYRFQTVTNADNKVVEIFARFTLQANGATLDNGFGFNLPDCDPSLTGAILKVTGYHVSHGYIALNSNGNESGQTKPTMIVWDNTSDLMPDMSNTVIGWPYHTPVNITLKLTTPGYFFDAASFALNSFNPFIICGMERGKEVHLSNMPPTSLANQSLFGMWDDNSIPSQNRYYKTISNLPWAIDISESFAWPIEKIDITGAHLKFATWAESSGSLFPDWYQDNPGYRNSSLIYSH